MFRDALPPLQQVISIFTNKYKTGNFLSSTI